MLETKEVQKNNKKLSVKERICLAELEQDRLTNVVHMRHRMEVWDDRMEKVGKMKMLVDANEEIINEDLVQMVLHSEEGVKRTMKYDVDSFLARQINLSEDECVDEVEEPEEETPKAKPKAKKGEVDPAPGGDDLDVSYLKSMQMTIDKYSKKHEDFMDKLRADYKGISLIECIVYANLIVFSLAATVAYLFYDAPGSASSERRKDKMKNTMINIPVNFGNVKVPKKVIKMQLKKKVNEKDTTENML